jgi:regulator of PEP synthase PpsR (kinase-PPPase family)
MLEYAAWLERNAASLEPTVELLDTTERSVEETAAAVYEWITARG